MEEEKRITQMLEELGIDETISHFDYLKKAIIIVKNDPEIKGEVSKLLYPKLANECHKSPGTIQNDIHRVIKEGWRRANRETKIKWFSNIVDQEGTPSNCKYIFTLAEKLALQESTPKERAVAKVLNELGVSAHLYGYRFLKQEILYVLEDFSIIEKGNRLLFNKIKRDYCNVSDRISETIKKGWTEANPDIVKKIFDCEVSETHDISASMYIRKIASYLHN